MKPTFLSHSPTRVASTGRTLAALLLALVLVLGVAGDAGAQSFWEDLLASFEASIGAAVAQDVQDEYGPPARLPTDQQRWLDAIFGDIVLQAQRRDVTYSLTVLESDVVNAFAAPGGYIFLTTALLERIGHDTDALANVLGHEVAHVEHRHGINALGRNLGLQLLLELAFGDPQEGDEVWRVIAGVSVGLMQLGWSREQEHESDELGQSLAAGAGYDPEGMVRFFRLLQQLEGKEAGGLEFLRTHPLTSERIERAEARAAALVVEPRSAPKPSWSGSNEDAAAEADKEGTAPTELAGEETRAPLAAAESPPVGRLYEDPAGRFSLHVPEHFASEPHIFLNITRFDGPNFGSLWVFVERPGPEDVDAAAAADRMLRFYEELYPHLRIERGPTPASLGELPGVYVEYRYTNDAGVIVREGGYFALHGDVLYAVQFAEPAFMFSARQGDYAAMAATFAPGDGGYGAVDAETLAGAPLRTRPVGDAFVMDVSALWPLTWQRPRDVDRETSPQVAEFLEIGEQGYMAVFEYRTRFSTRPMETAQQWLLFVLENQIDVEVHEPVHSRPVGPYDGASFLVSWSDGRERWMQYSTTVVVDSVSYEIGIAYRADGFAARRAEFDRWLDSWRPAAGP